MNRLEPCTLDDFCKRYDIARSTFYNWQSAGEAPRSVKIGNRIYILDADEREWQEARRIRLEEAQE